jgi:hypothetical protein
MTLSYESNKFIRLYLRGAALASCNAISEFENVN